MSLSNELQISKAIGSKDYNRAIELLKELIQKDKKDLFALPMIAQCYEWVGDQENAIKFAEKTLAISPDYFSMHMLSARHWFKLKDEERTYHSACRATEFFEEDSTKLPKWVLALFKVLSFIPKFKNLKSAEDDFKSYDKKEVKQYVWAKEFVKSYELKHGGKFEKQVH